MAVLNLKKNPKPGICAVMRCTKATYDGTLCLKHLAETDQSPLPLPDHMIGDSASPEMRKVLAEGATLAKPITRAELLVTRRDELLETLAAVSTLDLQAQIQFEGMTDPVTGLVALGVLREDARKMGAELDTLRTQDKAPHLAGCRDVDGMFKPALDTARAVVKACTDRIEAHANAQRAEQERVLAANRAALLAASRVPETVLIGTVNGPVMEIPNYLGLPMQPVIAVELPPQVRFRTEFSYEVSDLSLIPEAHWRGRTLAELHAFVLDHIKTTHGTSPIPGIEIVRSEKVVTK